MICLAGSVAPLSAQNSDQPDEIVDVDVTVFMIDIDEIDSVKQTFTGSVFFSLKWNDPDLAHSGPDSLNVPLTDNWYPHTQILNQQRLVDTFPETVEIRPNGDVIFRQRVWGHFSQSLDLEHFPFDKQQLQLRLVNVTFGYRQVRYRVSEESGVAESFRIPDWRMTGSDVRAEVFKIDEKSIGVSSVVLTVEVERYTSYFLLKVILPLMLIVAMSWAVFWIDSSLAPSQISIAVTAMLTLIAYRFAIGGMVPRLGFMTSLDYYVMGSTILVFISLMEVIYTARLWQQGREATANRIHWHARWIIPLLYAVIVVETLLFWQFLG